MEEREQNELCHLFMGHLEDSERQKADKHYQVLYKIQIFNFCVESAWNNFNIPQNHHTNYTESVNVTECM